MQSFFARRTSWNLATNRYSEALEAHRRAGKALLDLTASNPTNIGLEYRADFLLQSFSDRRALQYDPQAKGLREAREAVAAYYAERSTSVSPDDLILTTSTSEAYSFVFRLLCDPGDAVLVPTPSYPLFDFLADIQDVKLFPYELVYDHGWQIEVNSLFAAVDRAVASGARCRAILVVHPNNPTGSYVQPREFQLLNDVCAANDAAIIADEVFLDYSLESQAPLTFAANEEALTFTLSGLSKIAGLPQMKVAWIAVSGPPRLKREAMDRLDVIADTYLSMNAPIQHAIPAMLDERSNIQPQLMARVRRNLEELDSRLAKQNLCQRLQFAGGWYAILRVPARGSDEELAIALLERENVLVQPGHFYDFAAEGFLVASLITPPTEFAEGITRFLRFVSGLP